MSEDTIAPKDIKKTETVYSDVQIDSKSIMNKPIVSFLAKETIHTPNQRSTKNMTQNIDLFRKYLLTKAQCHMGKPNVQGSETMKRSPPQPLTLPNIGSTSRPPTRLEQELLPGFRTGAMSPASLNNIHSSKAQLTIFYSGAVNVYDDVPVDKAQAIMLLAGESSLPNPAATKSSTTPNSHSNLPSISNLQAELPIARKHSLQQFLKKRRDRIMNRSPYASPSRTQENGKPASNDCSIDNQTFSPAPFPSRLGFFFPVSPHMA